MRTLNTPSAPASRQDARGGGARDYLQVGSAQVRIRARRYDVSVKVNAVPAKSKPSENRSAKEFDMKSRWMFVKVSALNALSALPRVFFRPKAWMLIAIKEKV